MLIHPNFSQPFEVNTDAQNMVLVPCLAQWYKDKLKAVTFASRSFSPTKPRWPIAHQELFAIKWGFEHFHPYILQRTK